MGFPHPGSSIRPAVTDVARFRLRDSAISWRDVEQEVVALDLESGVYFSLIGSARTIWLALSGGSSLDDVSALLVTNYGIEPGRAVSDVMAFFADLEKRGFIEQVAG
jgi:Coenzyme PQQ synthesis protein D (PqqD)